MTNELTMKRSNLVLPVSGYELDREEMCYVEGGGIYISYSAIQSFMMAASGVTGVGLWGKMWAYKSTIAGLISSFFSWVWGIPIIGPIIAIWIGVNALIVAAGFIDAYLNRKGVDFTYSWFTVKFKLK